MANAIGDSVSLSPGEAAVLSRFKIKDLQPGAVFTWGAQRYRIDTVSPSEVIAICIAHTIRGDQVYQEVPPPDTQGTEYFHPLDYFNAPLPDDGPSKRVSPGANAKTGLMTEKYRRPPRKRVGNSTEKADVFDPELKDRRPPMLRNPQIPGEVGMGVQPYASLEGWNVLLQDIAKINQQGLNKEQTNVGQ